MRVSRASCRDGGSGEGAAILVVSWVVGVGLGGRDGGSACGGKELCTRRSW